MKKLLSILSAIPLCLLLQAPLQAQSADAERMRHIYLMGDHTDYGVLEGEALVQKPNAELATRGIYLLGAIRNRDFIQHVPVYAMLTAMIKEAPDSPWTLLVRAATADMGDEAERLCDEAIRRAGKEALVPLLASEVMLFSARAANYAPLASFIEKHKAELETTTDGLVSLASLYDRLALVSSRPDPTGAALYNRALQQDPHNTRIAIAKAIKLINTDKKPAEAQAVTEAALPYAPESTQLHMYHCNSISAGAATKAEKARLIRADLEVLVAKVAVPPFKMLTLFGILRNYSKPDALAIAELILQKQPQSQAADAARLELDLAKYRAIPTGTELPAEIRDEAARKLIALVNRPTPTSWYAENVVSNTLQTLLLDKDDVESDLLLEAAKAVRADVASPFAVAVATEKAHLPELEHLALTRIAAGLGQARQRSAEWKIPANVAPESTALWNELSSWYDVLGYAQLQAGKMDAASENLTAAERLNDKAMPPLMHLGKFYQMKKDFPKAESYLARAMAAPYYGQREHPAIGAYRELYVASHGSKDGLEKYLAAVNEKDRARRKPLVLRERIAEPQTIPAFSLKDLDGKTVRSEDLVGKVVVINFWGTWCGPCRIELPEFQKLWEKYRNDPQVAILTIEDDPSAELGRKFAADKGYNFPILWRDEYLAKAKINLYPTTWFLDTTGKRAFQKFGGTSDLEAEFSWRVEALRPGAAKQ